MQDVTGIGPFGNILFGLTVVDADDELSIHLLYTVGVIVFNLAKYTFTAWTLPLVLQGTTQTSCSREKPSAPCKPARADQKSPERKQSVSAKPE